MGVIESPPSTTSSEGAPSSGGVPPSSPSSSVMNPNAIKVDLFARTDVGRIREHNEDNFLVADLSRRTRSLLETNRVARVGQHGLLLVVCDGMGGAAAGEIASQLAVDVLFERMCSGLSESRPLMRNDIARRLVLAVEAAGTRIFQEAKADRNRRGMGTTATAAALVDDHLFLAQVGDSRGYILREGKLVLVTRDQSLVNQLIEAGQLTEEEAETFEHNNIIMQALGTADTVQVDLTYVKLCKGDVLMLCSDGLSGMVRADDIRDLMLSAEKPIDACKALTERANQNGGHDNITVVIARFDGESLESPGEETEALRYQKYPLPDPSPDSTEPLRPFFGAPASSPNGDAIDLVSMRPPVNSTLDEPIDIPQGRPAGLLLTFIALIVIAAVGVALVLTKS